MCICADDGDGNGERLEGRVLTAWSLVIVRTPESRCATKYTHPLRLTYRDELKGVGRLRRMGDTKQSLRGRMGNKQPGVDNLFEDVTRRCSKPGVVAYQAVKVDLLSAI